MKAFLKNLTILFYLVGLSACEKISGNGDVVTESRAVSSFDQVHAATSGEVYLTQGPVQEVKLEGESNIIAKYNTEVNSGKLTIDLKKNVRLGKHKKVKIYITIPEVSGISMSGSGTFRATTPLVSNNLSLRVSGSGSVLATTQAQNLQSDISGSGNVNLSGTAQTYDANVSGSGQIASVDLVAQDAKIRISGSGNVTVHVQNSLQVDISGSGTVRYKGTPSTINSNISGSGRLISLN